MEERGGISPTCCVTINLLSTYSTLQYARLEQRHCVRDCFPAEVLLKSSVCDNGKTNEYIEANAEATRKQIMQPAVQSYTDVQRLTKLSVNSLLNVRPFL